MGSKEKYEKLIVKRFNKKFKEFGLNIRSIGWDNNKNKDLRFKNIFKVANLKDCKNILDIGCGFGDLSTYIKKKKIKLFYTGIDINNKFIEINKKKKNKINCNYYNSSIFDFKKKYDLNVSFGLLNFKKCSNNYVKKFINESFKKSKKACLIDFISSDHQKRKEDFINYYEPEKIIKIVRKITKNFSLFSDYKSIPQKEFTIILYK